MAVLSLESVDVILKCDHSNVLSIGSVCFQNRTGQMLLFISVRVIPSAFTNKIPFFCPFEKKARLFQFKLRTFLGVQGLKSTQDTNRTKRRQLTLQLCSQSSEYVRPLS